MIIYLKILLKIYMTQQQLYQSWLYTHYLTVNGWMLMTGFQWDIMSWLRTPYVLLNPTLPTLVHLKFFAEWKVVRTFWLTVFCCPRTYPPSQLKLISGEVETENFLEPVTIIDHKGSSASIKYLIVWKSEEEEDSWVKPIDFDDQSIITDYWNRRGGSA